MCWTVVFAVGLLRGVGPLSVGPERPGVPAALSHGRDEGRGHAASEEPLLPVPDRAAGAVQGSSVLWARLHQPVHWKHAGGRSHQRTAAAGLQRDQVTWNRFNLQVEEMSDEQLVTNTHSDPPTGLNCESDTLTLKRLHNNYILFWSVNYKSMQRADIDLIRTRVKRSDQMWSNVEPEVSLMDLMSVPSVGSKVADCVFQDVPDALWREVHVCRTQNWSKDTEGERTFQNVTG